MKMTPVGEKKKKESKKMVKKEGKKNYDLNRNTCVDAIFCVADEAIDRAPWPM
ncbi:hypothetical protein J6590_041091 [Homalodisca vitripennis]|nr:hypothetical protein J6590_041091 [Homalodisca vitripennis]